MKLLLPLLIALTFISCKKDDVDHPVAPSDCLFVSTFTSFDELDLSQTINDDLFIMNLDVNDEAHGLMIDLNCDGHDDLLITGTVVDQSQGGGSHLLSKCSIQTLNANTYLLRDSMVETTFELTTLDTNNFDINFYELVSSYPTNGGVLLYETTNIYATNVDSTSVISSSDPRWTSSPFNDQIVRYRRKITSNSDYQDGNGYWHYLTYEVDHRRGIAPDQVISWIPIKFVTNAGNVKMGYIKLKPQLFEGAVSVGVDCWAIQR